MIKILDAKQIKAWDTYTIEHEPIASIELMERACHAFVSWFSGKFDASYRIGVVCGTGNNGGDGLGIARMLYEWSYPVTVWIVRADVQQSVDFSTNLTKLPSSVPVHEITPEKGNASFKNVDILIDGIFGSGLSRPVEGLQAEVIRAMNVAAAIRISIDIPSGLCTDAPSGEVRVHAHHTVSFQTPKLAFLLPDNKDSVGKWTVVGIGLDKSFLETAETSFYLVERRDAKLLRKPRSTFDHKGKFGRALMVAGSYGKMGAVILTAAGALRAGVGLLTLYTPKAGYAILQGKVPEAMVLTDPHDEIITTFPENTKEFSVLGIGPGMGLAEETVAAFGHFLSNNKTPLVIDADALNILAMEKEWLERIPPGSILSPHPGEFERLAGSWRNDYEKLDKLGHLAARIAGVVVLKGAYSAIADPSGRIFFNTTGNPGMATGGSGDALTGILTGLLAQGYETLHAAILGVFLHGLAGDLAVQGGSEEGLVASDLLDFLPQAFKRLG